MQSHKLMDEVRGVLRTKNYSYRTEQSYMLLVGGAAHLPGPAR